MLKLSADVRTAWDNEGGIVLDVRCGRMLRANSTGARILEMLQAGAPEDEIVSEIVRRYQIGEATAQSDLREFLVSLADQDLLLPAQAPALLAQGTSEAQETGESRTIDAGESPDPEPDKEVVR